MCLLNPANPDIAAKRDAVIDALMTGDLDRAAEAQGALAGAVFTNVTHREPVDGFRRYWQTRAERDQERWDAWDAEYAAICSDCNGRGWIVREYPVFADGGYSDIEQVETRCACNPEPDDVDLFIAENDLPLIDFDPAVCDAHYEGI